MKTRTFILLIAAASLLSCHKTEDAPEPHFSYSFWTDKPGYPILVSLMSYYDGMERPNCIGTLDTFTSSPVTDCGMPNTLSGDFPMGYYISTYRSFLKPPFYYWEGQWEGMFQPSNGACMVVKLERDTTLRKVTFWTSNAAHFEAGGYLTVQILGAITWTHIGTIGKSFPSAPDCGADSTLNALFPVGREINYRVYWGNDSLIYSGTQMTGSSDCAFIEVP